MKTDFPDKWNYLYEKLAYPYGYFNSINNYQKPVNNSKKKDFFGKLKNYHHNDEEIERTRKIFEFLNCLVLELEKF